MLNSYKIFEKYLQRIRFRKVLPYVADPSLSVLDFGGNRGELQMMLGGNAYTLVNYDHTAMYGRTYDRIVMLAVLEHLAPSNAFALFKTFTKLLRPGGQILLTTPTPASKGLLEILAAVRILDPENIAEHQHYWDKKDLTDLGAQTGLTLQEYKKFQLGFNQFAVFSLAPSA